MSLSPQEKIEFERLTADLALDNSDLKKMAKRERATAMSYVALPSMSIILMVMTISAIIIALGGLITHNQMLTLSAGAFGMSICVGMTALLLKEKTMAYRKTGTSE